MGYVDYINDPSNGACDHNWRSVNEYNDECPQCGATRRREHRCDRPSERPNDDRWTCDECEKEWAVIDPPQDDNWHWGWP